MKASCRKERGVTRCNSDFVNMIGRCSIAERLLKLLSRDGLTKSEIKLGAWISCRNVPKLGFSVPLPICWLLLQADGPAMKVSRAHQEPSVAAETVERRVLRQKFRPDLDSRVRAKIYRAASRCTRYSVLWAICYFP
jgi:hypothetical protein